MKMLTSPEHRKFTEKRDRASQLQFYTENETALPLKGGKVLLGRV